MNSEQTSTIAAEPFIQEFVYAIIQSIRAKNFIYEKKQVIHADLVPKVSTKVMHASLGEKKIKLANKSIMDKEATKPKLPIAKPKIMSAPVSLALPKTPITPEVTEPTIPQGLQAGSKQKYGRVAPLLSDPSLSVIECQGVGKPLTVTRMGQKQITKIILSAEDIKKILDDISDTAHIPLLEGVFRAAVDNFSVNAVVSEIIGSKFIIKKQVTYATPGMGGNYGQ